MILDLISIIPILNIITAIIATGSIQLYYFIKGVPGWYASLAGDIIEYIPALSALPGITLGVIATILIDRATATKLGQTALKAAGPAAKVAQMAGGKGNFLKKAAPAASKTA